MNFPAEMGSEIAVLHAELAGSLERIAWAILRDWPLAADAVQDAFVLLTEKWPEIAVAQRRGWLVRTVQLSAHNLRRKEQRAQQLPYKLHGLRQAAGLQVGAETKEEAETQGAEQWIDRLERLRQAVDALPAAQQQIVRLRLDQEQTFAEIAQTLKLPLGTVLSRMRLALEKLRRNMCCEE